MPQVNGSVSCNGCVMFTLSASLLALLYKGATVTYISTKHKTPRPPRLQGDVRDGQGGKTWS